MFFESKDFYIRVAISVVLVFTTGDAEQLLGY